MFYLQFACFSKLCVENGSKLINVTRLFNNEKVLTNKPYYSKIKQWVLISGLQRGSSNDICSCGNDRKHGCKEPSASSSDSNLNGFKAATDNINCSNGSKPVTGNSNCNNGWRTATGSNNSINDWTDDSGSKYGSRITSGAGSTTAGSGNGGGSNRNSSWFASTDSWAHRFSKTRAAADASRDNAAATIWAIRSWRATKIWGPAIWWAVTATRGL